MKTTITKSNFVNCELLRDNFTYEALEALFDYFENYERDCNEEMDFDPIAIRSEFTEYDDIDECLNNYFGDNSSEALYIEDKLEWLQDRTQVIEFNSGIIVGDF